MDLISFVKNFIIHYRPRLRTVLFLFFASAAVGVVTVFIRPDLMEQIVNSFSERFGDDPSLDMALALEIFQQNLMVSAIAWLGGLLFAIPPVFIVLTNGFILGYVVTFTVAALRSSGGNIGLVAAALVPHAIFELPAFIAAAALGLSLGLEWLQPENRGHRLKILGESFKRSFFYFLAIAGILFIAAIIEVFVSGKLVDNL